MIWEQIWNTMNERGIARPRSIFIHNDYALPSRKWLFEQFPAELAERQRITGTNLYSFGKNPCGVFSFGAMVFASEAQIKTPGPDQGLAFGVLGYTRDLANDPTNEDPEARKHAINFALVQDGDNWDTREFVYFDAQPKTQVFLSKTEVDSISFTVL